MRIGGSRQFAFGLQRTNREVELGRRNRFTASTLFSRKSDGTANDIMKLFTRKSFVLTGIFLLVPPSFLEAFSRFGALSIPDETNTIKSKRGIDQTCSSFFSPPKHTDWADVETVTIVFHGAGGEDEFTDELMKNLNSGSTESKPSQQQSSYNHIVDWSEYSANIFQASYSGQKVGRIAAKELLKQVGIPGNKLTAIHFIGISVGAFAADAAVNEVTKEFETRSSKWQNPKTGTPPFVQLTLLDPFQQRGIFGFGYGNNEFGKSADYAEQYLNTDDPVPSTNKPLKKTVCYDVTSLRPENIFGHDWPLVYYARSDRCGQLEIESRAKEENKGKAGTVVVL